MYIKSIYWFKQLAMLVYLTLIISCAPEQNEDRDAIVKIALRDAGNQLLLFNQDSTSLILPVQVLNNSKYQLSFQEPLMIEPDKLVTIIKESIQKSDLPNYYRVEVIQCADEEVAYSYEIKNLSEKDIIPCAGRYLPSGCYTIQVKFTHELATVVRKKLMIWLILIIIFIMVGTFYRKRKKALTQKEPPSTFSTIGSFQFYPEQNKLVKKAIEIRLSKKECELLAIFVASPNQIIKRDELTKKVWEDQGVFVGRSLDTYISKLRKILQDDEQIRLSNIHGVGYKLEVN